MSGYKPYPKYKESGFKWLREVPEHWELVQSRRLFTERKDRAFQGDRQLTASQKHGILYQEDFASLEGVKVMQVILGADLLKHVEPNDFVISMRSFQGGLEWSGLRGSISSAYVMLIPNESIYAGYFKWAFKSQPYLQALQSTSNLVRDGQALRFDNFAQVHLPVVPLGEQKSIATFLDRETSKLDILIREQKELITLLQEKRQALISNAVTKGLNPKAKMKDSGVEWLGEVPEHWEVKPLKYLGEAITGLTYDPTEVVDEGDGVLVLRSSNVQERRITFEDNVYVKSKIPDHLLTKMGDILICSRNGSRALIGKNAKINSSCENITWGAFMTMFRSPYHEFLFFVFNSPIFVSQSSLFLTATINQLTIGNLNSLIIPFPPLDEQKAIAAFLEGESIKIDTLIKEAEETIELMHEHRASLISEAVTGKIDVRKQA